MNPGRLKTVRVLLLCIAAAAGTLVATPAFTQNWSDFFSAIINQAIINNAVKTWNAVDPDVQQCLINSYGLSPAQLAQNGITAKDSRISAQMQSCQQSVAQARYQAEQQQRALEEQREAQERAAEDARKVQERAADEARKAQEAAEEQARREEAQREAVAKAQAETRHKNLMARFSSAQVDAIENNRIIVGMTKDAVLESRGKPDSKEVIPPDDEMWVYGSERISISKGRVTYVGH